MLVQAALKSWRSKWPNFWTQSCWKKK